MDPSGNGTRPLSALSPNTTLAPDLRKKALRSSHLRRGRQPCEKPCISDAFLTNGAHGRPAPYPYITLSCSDPPRRSSSGGEKALTALSRTLLERSRLSRPARPQAQVP
uniref:Uncharacterized protein n=1 Tax=Zea mays TaxID=4577 RepID=C4J3H6_MAIZE|nr:unknown [Zea mays]